MAGGAWWAAVHGVAKSRTWLSDFTFTFHFHALEKEMATHSSVLAWRTPGTAEPGGLPSMGSHRVGHNWSDLAAAAAAAPIQTIRHVCPKHVTSPNSQASSARQRALSTGQIKNGVQMSVGLWSRFAPPDTQPFTFPSLPPPASQEVILNLWVVLLLVA